MKITISAGTARVERDAPTPRARSWRTLPPDASIGARRRRLHDLLAQHRRARFYLVDGGPR